MIVYVQLFAAGRDAVGAATVEVELPEPATVADLRRALGEQYPPLQPTLGQAMVAVNHEYANNNQPLPPQAELALIPPVSGG